MSGTVTGWIHQFQEGDRSVADRIWAYFAPNLLRNLSGKCKQLKIHDEDDIALVAFHQLLGAMEKDAESTDTEDPPSIVNRKEFWRLLHIATKREIYDCVRYDKAKRRGGEKNIVPIEGHKGEVVSIPIPRQEQNEGEIELDAVLAERLQHLANQMRRPQFATIVEMKMARKSNSDVAEALGLSLRTTQYLIAEIKEAWLDTFRAA